MAPKITSQVPAIRRSSRIQQQTKPSSKPTTSTNTSVPTKRRNQKTPQRKEPSSKGTAPTKGTASTKGTPATFFFLLKLPREIRDMIYTLLIANGHLSILRISREINREAQSTFYRAAICRQNAGHLSPGQAFNPRPPRSELLVQNFELRCNLHSGIDRSPAMQTRRRDPSERFLPANFFGRGDVRRNRIVLELGFRRKTSFADADYSLDELLDQPESFIGFRLLVVKFLAMPRGWSTDNKNRIRQVVMDRLEPKLGSAVHYQGEEDGGERIEFRPWSRVGVQRHVLEPVLFLKPAVWGSERENCVEVVDDR